MEPIAYGPLHPSTRYRVLGMSAPFERVAAAVEGAIRDEGFLLLHVLDAQEILRRAAHAIRPLRQYLFFHPDLMRRLLELAPGAVPEAPLKIVVLEHEDGQVRLLAPLPLVALAEYPSLRELSIEISTRIDRVLAAVTDGRAT